MYVQLMFAKSGEGLCMVNHLRDWPMSKPCRDRPEVKPQKI